MVTQSKRQSRRQSRSQRGGNVSLQQGEKFQSYHTTQHGGSRDALVGAPVEYSGVLESGLRGAAGLETYDAHFRQAETHGQSGGSRRRRRSQRGGAMAPAPVGQSYTLNEKYADAGGVHETPSPMKGGRRQQSRRQQSRRQQSRRQQSRRQQSRRQQSRRQQSRRQQSRRQQSRRQQSRRQQSRRRSQRGGYAPVSQASMLLEDYSKAGLPSFKQL